MIIENFLSDARSIITVISFVTFIGIIWWAYVRKRPADFDDAALLPFAEDETELDQVKAQYLAREKRRG
ncbi:cbb3-type cytochrome c oxidase subunit 3 [Collimonas sp.]|jgi:cytochrome c oxidase cbb3-type subunit 4|uniref:cbb3-type cytochrome oxidase subunit 3 n=1 Tax=Collimonas sp. TaxID=1963772 RepID=UPI002C648C30|nr:cbb3-type cytochrome c oxidase subunit 3 [Collimonas sp.]HWW04698.1 cbb3-type cytochrome c oxidase subunit 3 [Collimonas sp.]